MSSFVTVCQRGSSILLFRWTSRRGTLFHDPCYFGFPVFPFQLCIRSEFNTDIHYVYTLLIPFQSEVLKIN